MSAFLLCSELDKRAGLGGALPLSKLSATPEAVREARSEMRFLNSSLGKAAHHYRSLDILLFEQRETVEETAPDGTVITRQRHVPLIPPDEVWQHCSRNIGDFDQSVPRNYIEHLCRRQRRLDTLEAFSERSDSTLNDVRTFLDRVTMDTAMRRLGRGKLMLDSTVPVLESLVELTLDSISSPIDDNGER